MVDLHQSVRGSQAACGSIGLMRQQEDWYAYLNIATDAPTEQIEQAVERLSRQATALAVTAPERSQRLRDTVRAIKRDLLSGPEARARYDARRDAAASPQAPSAASAASAASGTVPPPPTAAPWPSSYSPPMAPTSPVAGGPTGGGPAGGPGGGPGAGGASAGGPGGGSPGGGERISARLVRFLRTGWTCAECGKEALPSDKFCTRCGTVITPTRHEAAAPTTRVTCVNCAAPMGVNDAFCARCGTRVSK